MAFAERLSLAAFDALAQMGPSFDRDAVMNDVVSPAVMAHLEAVKADGRLGRIEGTDNRGIRLATAWNDFLDGTDSEWRYVLEHGLSQFVLIWAIEGCLKGQDDPSVREQTMLDAYESMCRLMEEGRLVKPTFFPTMTAQPALDDLRDGATGDRCRLMVEDWQPRLQKFDLGAKDAGYWIPLETVAAPVVETIEIDLPTGRLLMGDYLRMPGMHEGLEARIEAALGSRIYDDEHSTNSARGRANTTRAIWNCGSVLQICTTNTTVAVHHADGRLVVCDDHDGSGNEPAVAVMRRAAEISCDRWTVLLADRSDVLTLMKEGRDVSGKPAADGVEADLDAWMAGPDFDAVEIVVEPGRWRVSFGEALADQTAAKSIDVDTDAIVWFAMERVL
jgi:hypothetical protein